MTQPIVLAKEDGSMWHAEAGIEIGGKIMLPSRRAFRASQAVQNKSEFKNPVFTALDRGGKSNGVKVPLLCLNCTQSKSTITHLKMYSSKSTKLLHFNVI